MEYFFWDLEIWKFHRTFWKKATFRQWDQSFCEFAFGVFSFIQIKIDMQLQSDHGPVVDKSKSIWHISIIKLAISSVFVCQKIKPKIVKKQTIYDCGQRVIRREPKIECYVLTKVKSPPFFSIILQRFLVIFSTPTFISFTKLKIWWSFWGAEQV